MRRATARTIVGAALALLAPASHAAAINVTLAGSAAFGAGPVGYMSGSVTPNPNMTSALVGVGIGGNSFTTANRGFDFSATGQFNTWCVDIYHWLAGGTVTYHVDADGDELAASLDVLRPGVPSGATRVDDLLTLANAHYGEVDTRMESAAFQLAVWAITYGAVESGRYVINTTNGGFRVDGATAASTAAMTANAWLSSLASMPATGQYKLTYLHDGTSGVTQDQIVFHAVPAPSALLGLGIGLLALGIARRRKLR